MNFSSVFIISAAAVAACFMMGLGNALRIEGGPSDHFDTSTRRLEISCKPDDNKVISAVLLLQLSKDSVVLANIQGDLSLTVTDPDIKAVGHIDSVYTKSYLNLTVPYPDQSNGGLYTCNMYFLDGNNLLQQDSITANVTWDNLDPSKLGTIVKTEIEKVSNEDEQIKNLTKSNDKLMERLAALESKMENQTRKVADLESKDKLQQSKISDLESKDKLHQSKITNLETKNVAIKSEIGNQTSKIDDLESNQRIQESKIAYLESNQRIQETKIGNQTSKIADLQVKDSLQEHKLGDLEKDVENQTLQITALERQEGVLTAQITYLKSKENSVVAFRAEKRTTNVSPGTVTSWTATYSYNFQQGGAFNTTTGVFKAPTDGLYAFNLYVEISGSNDVDFRLHHNGVVVAYTRVLDGDGWDTSSHSTVVYMKALDTVVVHGSSTSDKTRVYLYFNGYRVTKL